MQLWKEIHQLAVKSMMTIDLESIKDTYPRLRNFLARFQSGGIHQTIVLWKKKESGRQLENSTLRYASISEHFNFCKWKILFFAEERTILGEEQYSSICSHNSRCNPSMQLQASQLIELSVLCTRFYELSTFPCISAHFSKYHTPRLFTSESKKRSMPMIRSKNVPTNLKLFLSKQIDVQKQAEIHSAVQSLTRWAEHFPPLSPIRENTCKRMTPFGEPLRHLLFEIDSQPTEMAKQSMINHPGSSLHRFPENCGESAMASKPISTVAISRQSEIPVLTSTVYQCFRRMGV